MGANLAWLIVAVRPPLLIALGICCVLIALSIPYAAFRGRLHIPGYVGLALVAFAVAFILGHVSGRHGVRGTHSGAILSVLFFLLIAVAVGSILALFFHRDRLED